MFLLIEEAVSSVSDSFITNPFAAVYDPLKYSVIEGRLPSSIVYNFDMPNLLGGHINSTSLQRFLTNSIDSDGAAQAFLTSNLCFAIRLKDGDLKESLGTLVLDDITTDEQRDYASGGMSSEDVDALFAGKGRLQGAVLESLKDGETVLLNYDDIFGDNPDISLINKLLVLSEQDQNLNDFVFENFDVKIKYRVFVSYATKILVPDAVNEFSVLGTDSELRSLGLYGSQKISTAFVKGGVPMALDPSDSDHLSFGATFIMTELCTFEKEVFSYSTIENNLEDLQSGQLISRLMLANNTSRLASDFKGDASINIFLSCMLPIPNIINEATSYSVEEVQKEIADEDGEAGPLGLSGKVEVRDIVFKPVKIQNKICTRVSKDLLRNV